MLSFLAYGTAAVIGVRWLAQIRQDWAKLRSKEPLMTPPTAYEDPDWSLGKRWDATNSLSGPNPWGMTRDDKANAVALLDEANPDVLDRNSQYPVFGQFGDRNREWERGYIPELEKWSTYHYGRMQTGYVNGYNLKPVYYETPSLPVGVA